MWAVSWQRFLEVKGLPLLMWRRKLKKVHACHVRNTWFPCKRIQEQRRGGSPRKGSTCKNTSFKNRSRKDNKLTLKGQRLKCAELEWELSEMQAAITKTNIVVDHKISNDFTNILEKADDKITPFMSLFWQQQKKLFSSSPTGVRYHPMIIRFCLSQAVKSPSCYEELRNSKMLVLPMQVSGA